jgi:hypothetical protein
MLRSRPFRRPEWKPTPREERPLAPIRRLERNANYAGTLGAAVPKGEKAKPGKRTPNAEEKRWMDRITDYGCVACHMDGRGRVEPCVHHILRGGHRMGHLYTLPLCLAHHQHDTASGLIARHPYKAQFEARYGDEMALLCQLKSEIGETA